ncbi:TetR/AcrR family transcriptional regulator [Amycolatopsis australiensis]|uniref:DNA-binding transcriptional regulator, AcrR family n=1 Tax=Amycolatopsis australiensis TaxID=546364 RepID=A0A1K1T6J4_9PSEU|nr:TetR family transcriptional regulator C-terminal domain-containing protein [Amycolatopsis australiensis]SFW92211.1 DNA-binding transcriptional regulator, AcrR family [Amycolatopsis australiensis]
MTRKAVAVRREEIVLAALGQIRARGIAGVRAADVAKALDVSTALVFYHFGTLEALVIEAFRHAAETQLAALRDELDRTGPVETRLRAVLALYGPTGSGDWRLWIEAGAAAMRDERLRAVLQRLDRRWRDAVVALITEGVAAGRFRCPDPYGAAWRLTALLDGLAVQVVTRDGTVTAGDCARWVAQAVTYELGTNQPAK